MKRILLTTCIACMPLLATAKQTIPETHKVIDKHFANTSGSLITITQNDIKKSGATNIGEALQHQAGIQVSDSNSNAPGISMRGFGENASANTLILLNGFPLKNPDMSGTYLNAIPLRDVKEIEVIPSSGGILYGDDAVGGVINIITKQPKKFRANLFSNVGSYDQFGTGISLGQTLKNGFNYYLQGSREKNDGYRQHDDLHQSNLMGQVGYDYQSGSVLFNYETVNMAQDFPGAIQPSQSPTTGAPGEFQNVKINIYSLKWKQHLKGSWRFESQLARRNTDTNGNLYSSFKQYRSISSFMPRFIGLISSDNIMTTVGFEFRHNKYRYNMPSFTAENVNDNQNIDSGYTNFKIPIKDHWFGTLGGRWAGNYNTLNGDRFSDHALVSEQGLIYKPNVHWRFYLKRTGNFRFAKADETHTSSGIKQLKTQTGVSYETGLTWQDDTTLIQTSIYQLDLKNEIAYQPAAPNSKNFGTNSNLDPTRRQGLLIHARYNLTKQWLIYVNYNYVDARMRSGRYKNKQIPFVSENSGQLASSYQINEHWNIYGAANYSGGRYASEDNANQDFFGGYTTYDASVQYNWNDWYASLRLNNIFNKQYYSDTLFVPPSTSYVYPADGRNYLLTIGYTFT